MERIKRKIGFYGCLDVNSLGRSEGLAMLWKKEEMVEIYNYSQCHISAWVEEDS